MQYLGEYKINLFIAGDGPLVDELKEQSNRCASIIFMGRVENPYIFFKQIDLLVVPSIREPFGNICIEAGLCKTPVLASNIDGIPEIIKHKFSGELITPTDDFIIENVANMAPIPEYVINSQTQELQAPMQINALKLANKIVELSKDTKRLNRYSSELYNTVIKKFSIKSYSSSLESVYRELHKY
jgi:glycosyltransferase involved in cell wall biosynthesis